MIAFAEYKVVDSGWRLKMCNRVYYSLQSGLIQQFVVLRAGEQ